MFVASIFSLVFNDSLPMVLLLNSIVHQSHLLCHTASHYSDTIPIEMATVTFRQNLKAEKMGLLRLRSLLVKLQTDLKNSAFHIENTLKQDC